MSNTELALSRERLRQAVTHAILTTGRHWRRAANGVAEAHGLSDATAHPLIIIGRMAEEPRQNALAEAVGIEGPSLVRLLDQLAAAGLVVRREDPSDRRAKVLGLTTEEPSTLDLALPRQHTGRLPQQGDVQFHWMSPAIYGYGQMVDTSSGEAIRTFTAAKTVADFCARRHKVGRKTYLSILKAYLQNGGSGGTPGATQPLLEAAQVCRVQSIIRADLAVLRA